MRTRSTSLTQHRPSIDPFDGIPLTRPFWSVMIPAYNSPALLARSLETVLAQDQGPERMQIEVVDDASATGDLATVVNDIGRGRVRYFRHSRNVGPTANFTTCIERSDGVWVHILHSDDLMLDGFYETFERRIEACPDAVMVAGPATLIDDQEAPFHTTPSPRTEGGYVLDAAFVCASQNPIQFVTTVVARSAYERAGGFDRRLCHAADWEMWTRLSCLGPVGWVEEPLGLYRMHAGSDTARLHRSTSYLHDCRLAGRIIAEELRRPDGPPARAAGGPPQGRRLRAGRGGPTSDKRRVATRCRQRRGSGRDDADPGRSAQRRQEARGRDARSPPDGPGEAPRAEATGRKTARLQGIAHRHHGAPGCGGRRAEETVGPGQ